MVKPTKKVHELNRNLFIEWSKGTLLKRGRKGRCLVLDGSDFARKCEAAEADLELGATLYLTDDAGKRITKITSDGKGYEEEALETRYRKLSPRDILRWHDEYLTPSGKWLPIYGRASGSWHTVGRHPYPGTEYRRPVQVEL
jgi:hypothetical protein